jgi:3-oxoacyl-[acyl-carrier protein] reductase
VTEVRNTKTRENPMSNSAILQGPCKALQGKNAVIFGAGGSIGAAVAPEFAAEGARVFLAGRTKATLEAVAKQIDATGGKAHTSVIDTLDDVAVNEYLDGVVRQTGKFDIVLDAAGPLAKEYGNGKMAVDLPVEEFVAPFATMVKSRFITARAAARSMTKTALRRDHFRDGQPGSAARARSHGHRCGLWRD